MEIGYHPWLNSSIEELKAIDLEYRNDVNQID